MVRYTFGSVHHSGKDIQAYTEVLIIANRNFHAVLFIQSYDISDGGMKFCKKGSHKNFINVWAVGYTSQSRFKFYNLCRIHGKLIPD